MTSDNMFHIRKPASTHMHPVTWCGAKPEAREKKLQGPHYDLTEWEWVRNFALDHPNICQGCVRAIMDQQPTPADDDEEVVAPF